MLILSKYGKLMRDMRNFWNVSKHWNRPKNNHVGRLSDTGPRRFNCSPNKSLESALHSWVRAGTIHAGERTMWLINGLSGQTQVPVMRTLVSSWAAFNGSRAMSDEAEAGIRVHFRKSVKLSYEQREALAGIYREHPKQTTSPPSLARTQG